LNEITVKNQQEFDAIPQDFEGCIYIGSPRGVRIVITGRKGYIIAWENSSVEAWGNSSVVAWKNSSVVARGNSSVEAWGNSSVEARENSSVEAWGNSSVVAWENSSVVARGNSSVEAWGNSSVVARGNSSVEAWENSSVVARGNSSVEAWGNSSVEAWENSSVEAWENSSVEAWGNTQIAKYSDRTNLKVSGNARIVTLPSTPEEYCDFYGIEVRDGQAILYKAVRDNLTSFHDFSFQYAVGETKENECDPSPLRDCSYGLHVSHLPWAIDFARGNSDFKILECSVPLNTIIVPLNGNGKVRTSELTVLREVPIEEWGVQGKIMAKQRRA